MEWLVGKKANEINDLFVRLFVCLFVCYEELSRA